MFVPKKEKPVILVNVHQFLDQPRWRRKWWSMRSQWQSCQRPRLSSAQWRPSLPSPWRLPMKHTKHIKTARMFTRRSALRRSICSSRQVFVKKTDVMKIFENKHTAFCAFLKAIMYARHFASKTTNCKYCSKFVGFLLHLPSFLWTMARCKKDFRKSAKLKIRHTVMKTAECDKENYNMVWSFLTIASPSHWSHESLLGRQW